MHLIIIMAGQYLSFFKTKSPSKRAISSKNATKTGKQCVTFH